MATYIRKRNVLIHPDGRHEKFDSISQAKRQSRHLQGAGHKVELDHSADPKPKPLHFPRYGSKRDAADRFIRKREREERDRIVIEKKKARGMAMSKAELRRLGALT